MRLCGCAAAVANALPVIKDAADIRLAAENGEGVVELLDSLSREDAGLIQRPVRALEIEAGSGRDRLRHIRGCAAYAPAAGRVAPRSRRGLMSR